MEYFGSPQGLPIDPYPFKKEIFPSSTQKKEREPFFTDRKKLPLKYIGGHQGPPHFYEGFLFKNSWVRGDPKVLPGGIIFSP